MASALNVISILSESFSDLQCRNILSYIEEGSCKCYDKPIRVIVPGQRRALSEILIYLVIILKMIFFFVNILRKC